MKIINKTPHPIHVIKEGNIIKTFPKSDESIRLKVQTEMSKPIGDIPTSVTIFGDPEGLPDEKTGIYFIVSQLVKNALPDRKDLLVPAEVVRDEYGNIIGCNSLGR